VGDGAAVRAGGADVPVRRPVGLHRPDRGPRGRAGRRPCRRVLCGRAPAAGRPSGPGGQDDRGCADAADRRRGGGDPAGVCIVHDVGAQHGFPLVRVGMHTGSAVERDGDWFGTTVNLAARVSAAASGGEALLTAATRAAAGEVEGVEVRERGRRAFRNVGERSRCTRRSGRGHTTRLGCRLIRCAGWRSTLAWRGPTHPSGRGVLLLLARVRRCLRQAPQQVHHRRSLTADGHGMRRPGIAHLAEASRLPYRTGVAVVAAGRWWPRGTMWAPPVA
jgi:hypothetical protein